MKSINKSRNTQSQWRKGAQQRNFHYFSHALIHLYESTPILLDLTKQSRDNKRCEKFGRYLLKFS